MSFFGDLYDASIGQVVGPDSITGDIYDAAADLVGEDVLKAALIGAGIYYAPAIGSWISGSGAAIPAAEAAATAGLTEAELAAAADAGLVNVGANVTAGVTTGLTEAELAAAADAGLNGVGANVGAGLTEAELAAAADAGLTGAGANVGAGAVGAAAGAASPALLSQLGELAKSYGVPLALLTSGLTGASAAKSAAQTQAEAAREANQLAYKIYGEQKALQEPFRQAGLGAQNKLLTYLGLPGGTEGADYGKYARDFGMTDFTADPGYAFRMSEGLKGLERSAAARGGLLSGSGLKNIQRFGQDLASQEYGAAYNRYQTNRANQLAPLGSLLASGQSAAANQGSAAGQYGATAGSNITGAGAATAAGNVGATNALTSALGSYLNYSSNQDLVNALTRRSAYGNPTA